MPTSQQHRYETIRYRLLLIALATLVAAVGAGGLLLAERDNHARDGRVAARYTLCLEIRELKITLSGFMRNHRDTEGAEELLRRLTPPTPADCVRFAHLKDDQLVEVPDG